MYAQAMESKFSTHFEASEVWYQLQYELDVHHLAAQATIIRIWANIAVVAPTSASPTRFALKVIIGKAPAFNFS
jgi:hypothetical protein